MIRVIFLKKIQGRLGTNGQQIICHPATRAQIIHCDDTVAQQRAGGGGASLAPSILMWWGIQIEGGATEQD